MKQTTLLLASLLLALAGFACGADTTDDTQRVEYRTSAGSEVVVEGDDDDDIEEGLEAVEDNVEDADEETTENYD